MRQKSDISECRSRGSPPSTLTLFATWSLSRCATCKESSYAKNKYNFFYHKSDAEYFFIQQFIWKNLVFSKKIVKNFIGGTFDYFLGEGGVLHQKLA